MKVGDKVKPTRGNHIGIVGIFTKIVPLAMGFTVDNTGEEIAEYKDYCECRSEDGKIFYCWEGDMEIIKE